MTEPLTQGQVEPIAEVKDVRRALNALRLEVDASIVNDIAGRVEAAFTALSSLRQAERPYKWALLIDGVLGRCFDTEQEATERRKHYTPECTSVVPLYLRPTAAPAGWRDIESAPKDGSAIIIGGADSGSMEGYWMADPKRNHWNEVGWFASDDDVLCDHPRKPANWQPLPPPPLSAAPGEVS